VPVIQFADDLTSVVRYALETTRATTTCPFHWNVTIASGMTPPKATLWREPEISLGAMVLTGKRRLSEESLRGNLERPQIVTVPSVRIGSLIQKPSQPAKTEAVNPFKRGEIGPDPPVGWDLKGWSRNVGTVPIRQAGQSTGSR